MFPIDEFIEKDDLWANDDGMRCGAADSGRVSSQLRRKARKRLDEQETEILGYSPYYSVGDRRLYDEPIDKKAYSE